MRTRSMLLLLAAAAAGCRPAAPSAPAPERRAAAECPGMSGDSARTSCGRMAGGMRDGAGAGPMRHGGMGMGMHGRMHGQADSAAHTRRSAAPADSAGSRSAAPAGGCPAATPALVDVGRSVFARGTCVACHGADGRGTPVAPDLTDGAWLHGDGSYGSIAQVVAAGVARPLRYPSAMPPMGGASLSPAEVCSVAAYVHTLSAEDGEHRH